MLDLLEYCGNPWLVPVLHKLQITKQRPQTKTYFPPDSSVNGLPTEMLSSFLLLPLIVVSAMAASLQHQKEVLVMDHRSKRAVHLADNLYEPCRVYSHSGAIADVQKNRNISEVHSVSDEEVDALAEQCQRRTIRSTQRPKRPILHPGTKWCGAGNIARSYDDLGTYADVDRCCRDHDHCSEFILGGECKYGLCNRSPFTRSSCDCDEEFRYCLMRVNDAVSNSVGVAYFNLAESTCFTYDYPSLECSGVISGLRRKKRAGCGITNADSGILGSWKFVHQQPYSQPSMSPKQYLGRSLAEPAVGPRMMGRMKNLMSAAGDVGTVIKTVAHSALDVYRQQRQAVRRVLV